MLRGPGGEPVDLKLRQTGRERDLKEGQIITDAWKQVGIAAELEITPTALQLDREYRTKFSGASTSAGTDCPNVMDRWRTDGIPTERNRWRGNNRGGYHRPEVDRWSREYLTTIDPGKRQDVLLTLMRFLAEDVAYVPLYYEIRVIPVRAGLKGVQTPPAGFTGTAFNPHLWYWE